MGVSSPLEAAFGTMLDQQQQSANEGKTPCSDVFELTAG